MLAPTNRLALALIWLLLLPLCAVLLCASAAEAGDSTPRDMFYEELKNPDAQHGTAAAYCLELHRPGTPIVLCNNRFPFQSGDGIRLHLRCSRSVLAYIVLVGSSGRKAILYPPPESAEDNRLEAGKEYIVPPRGLIRFDDTTGTERLFVLLANKPLDLDQQLSAADATIDDSTLDGTPQQVGDYGVMSNDNIYKLGEKAPGNGLVFITNRSTDRPTVVSLALKHTTGGDEQQPISTSPQTGAKPYPIGFIPPFLLEEMKQHNPGNRSLESTLKYMQQRAERTFSVRSTPTATNAGGVRELYDAGGRELEGGQLPGSKIRFEGEQPTHKFEADQIYDFSGIVRNYYNDVHSRNSIDGNGMKFIATENFGHDFANACWLQEDHQMLYGSPGADSGFATVVLLDVIGHEITHGVTEFESKLVYEGQSGALNEHLSDVFGQLIRQWHEKKSVKDADWLIGKGIWKPGINGIALRNMLHPGTAFDDPKIGRKDPQPAHLKDYVKLPKTYEGDWGGVHINSGIPNRAFALFATDVGGNAWEKPAKIWYAARAAAGSRPSFAQFAFYTIESAKKLKFTSEVSKLQKAWLAVGVTPSATEGDTLTPQK